MVTDKYLRALKQSFGTDGFENFDSYDYLHAIGSAKQALLHAALFCPDLSEVDGSVLLKMKIDDEVNLNAFYQLKNEKCSTLQEVERSFNFIEVLYCFSSGRDELSRESEEMLAELIARSWEGKLAVEYPNRKFKVIVTEQTNSCETLIVSFFEERADP